MSRYGVSMVHPQVLSSERRETDLKNRSPRIMVIFGDVCDLKLLNDHFENHVKGAELLSRVGKTFGDNFRKDDLATRYGGDEFIAFVELPDDMTEEEAQAVLNERLELLKGLLSKEREKEIIDLDEFDVADPVVAFGGSLGTLRLYTDEERAEMGDHAPVSTLQSIIHQADLKMYEHKGALKRAGIAKVRPGSAEAPGSTI